MTFLNGKYRDISAQIGSERIKFVTNQDAMNIISKNNIVLYFGGLVLLFSCTTQQPLSDSYEIDEAYWKPGESFGAPKQLSGSALSSVPQSEDDDFYSADAAKRNSYAPSYLDSTQSGQMNGMVPVWDPILGWRMVYDPNSSVNSGSNGYGSYGNSSLYNGGGYGMGYGSGYGSGWGNYGSYGGMGLGYGNYPFSNWGGMNPYFGMGLNLGLQSSPFWGSSYGMYNGWGGSYYNNPYGYGYGNGMYNPYYWNGWNSGYGSNGNGVPDQSTHVNRPSGGVGGAGGHSGNLVVHRHPKSLSGNITGKRGKAISDVLEKSVQNPRSAPQHNIPHNNGSGSNRPAEQHTTTPSRTQPPVHSTTPAPSRPAPIKPIESRGSMGGGLRPSGGGGSAPSRAGGSGGGSAPHGGGRRP